MERQGWIYLSGLPKFHYKKELIGYWMPYILLFLSAIVMTLCRFKAPKNDEAAVSQPANSKSSRNGKKGKKAAKAGTLCLALKGVPVKPTDEVDVDKTYELIALPE